jgi:UDP:flavonoid glycosyltransferase YjiC (YdhE family)
MHLEWMADTPVDGCCEHETGLGKLDKLDELDKLDDLGEKAQSKRILVAALGSLGDLHPCLALAVELKRRGHLVTVATTPYYRSKIEAAGMRFHPIRPDWDPTDRELIRQCEDLKRGPEVLLRRLVLPELRDTYADLLSAATGVDLMIAGELVFAAPLVAEKLKLRWVSVILSPCSFFSSYDPSVLVNVPGMIHLRKLGPPVYRVGLSACRLATMHWWTPVRNLRRESGLRVQCDPVFRDKFSPDLVLALFSGLLAAPQLDWPAQTRQPGFVFFDQESAANSISTELSAFLAAGDRPIVFTQGSTAVHNPGDFFDVSAEAAKRLGRRAVLLGKKATNGRGSPEILEVPYASYSQIFPKAAVIVHQGGSGTTGQAMRAGSPMLVVPYGWDQPDNARRVQRLGVGLHLSRSNYSAETAVAALERLLGDATFAMRAHEVAGKMQHENGLTAACDAIESLGS